MQNQTIPLKQCKTHTLDMTKVMNSRREGDVFKRRRKCKYCGLLIHTEEKIVSYGAKTPVYRNGWTSTRRKAPPKKVKKLIEPDFDNMTDDEIEAWITSGKKYYDD